MRRTITRSVTQLYCMYTQIVSQSAGNGTTGNEIKVFSATMQLCAISGRPDITVAVTMRTPQVQPRRTPLSHASKLLTSLLSLTDSNLLLEPLRNSILSTTQPRKRVRGCVCEMRFHVT